MGTFDVTLQNNKQIVFPPRCVVCEKSNPDGIVKLSFLGIKTVPLMTVAADKAMGYDVDPKYYGSNTSNKIDGIPACHGCASRLKWYHRLLKFAYYTAWLPAMPVMFLNIPVFIKVMVMILFAISPGIFTLVFPPSFGASFWDDKANFEFKSEKTAREFLALNSDATLKTKQSNAETNAA